jgi:hypothetical protein
MISLEDRGVLQNKFRREFRRRPPWKADWHTEELETAGKGTPPPAQPKGPF